MSVPNQKTITIHQTTQRPFVMVGIEEYQNAMRKMQPCSFAMYLYLAGNAEGYRFELSKVAFENATGYKKASYHRAYKELFELGYIYEDNGHLNFATSPKVGTKGVVQNWDSEVSEMNTPIVKNDTAEFQNCTSSYSEMNTEINNKKDKENKENKELKKASPSSPSSLDYLKTIIAPNGQYIGGEKKEQWLEDEVPNLWGLSKLARIQAIQQHTDFNAEQSQVISYSILDYKNRKLKTIRERDFYEDIFFIGE